ncbi:MAG: hypothetical protein OEW89_06260 [Gammaproteobacteria bacterium]|nr:hypothetical protein [Gammaproteobacteria bacterium]
MKKTIKEISINNLILDVKNARYGGDVAVNQRDAIFKLFQIKDMKRKVLNLARHIAEHGLDPTELLLVFPYKNKPNNYLVPEGNRRTLAMKLLYNPSLAPDDVYRQKIEKLTSPKVKRSVSKVQCSVLPNRKSSDKWVYLKHTGQNDGVGRVDWDGRSTDAFRARTGERKSAGRQILDYIEADKGFSSEIKKSLNKVDITNISRLFQGSPAKKAFGLVLKNGFLESAIPLDEFRNIVECVLGIMLEDDFKVKNIYLKEDQEKFIKNKIPTDILPSRENRLIDDKTWQLSHLDVKSLTNEQKHGIKPISNKKKAKKKSVRSKPQSENRSHLIDFTLRVTDKRCNKIYDELKNELDVHNSPNAVAVLFRVFLELTCDFYIKENRFYISNTRKLLKQSDNLRTKAQNIADNLHSKNALTDQEASALRKLASSRDELTSVDSLNKYVHASELSPRPKELNILMDNWSPLFKAIWK